ncbi:MAG: nucleoside diphosphate kinase regulator [Kiritimatiellia bacterium]|jgi:regulator of nucleoside diphosphate kinase|nr:nucleoside diphosphate kinase regulator [Kiritimatiellia bacterium]
MTKRAIHITRPDHQRLTTMLEEALARSNRDSAFLKELAHELALAEAVEPQDVPANVVTMNSRVILQDVDDGERTEYTLVFPDKADIEHGRLSVVSPIGTAILGYTKGSTVSWKTPGGPRQIKIADITYQPEAAGAYGR